jgi:hypothetical protein
MSCDRRSVIAIKFGVAVVVMLVSWGGVSESLADGGTSGLLRQTRNTQAVRIEAGYRLWKAGVLATEHEFWMLDVERLERVIDNESGQMSGYSDSGPCEKVSDSGTRSTWLCRPGSATGLRFWLLRQFPRDERRPSLGVEEAEASRRIIQVNAPVPQEKRVFESIRTLQEELRREYWRNVPKTK